MTDNPTTEQLIEHYLVKDLEKPPPEPALLVAWLNASQRSDIGSDADREIAMARIVRAAERGGSAHMEAVADWIGKLPPLPDPKAPLYDARTGRPAFHETNVLLELRIRVNGQLFTARESIDPFMFDRRFGDDDEFEKYIACFVRSSCGRMATSPDAYRYFRSLVWIVRPHDKHDLKRCADGWKAKPYCDLGLISKASRIFPSVDGVIEPTTLRDDVLGVCPCRCHRNDGSGASSGSLARMHGLRIFDESQLKEQS